MVGWGTKNQLFEHDSEIPMGGTPGAERGTGRTDERTDGHK